MASLKPPSSDAFNAAEWRKAYDEHGSGDRDLQLLDAALWIGAEVAAGRTCFSNANLSQLSPQWRAILAVAAHNREYRTVTELAAAESARMSKDGTLSTDLAANLRIAGAAGQQFTAAALSEAMTDLTENWLFDAAQGTGTEDPPADVAPIAIEAAKGYSFRKAMNTLWNQVWWEDWWLCEMEDGTSRWVAGDPEFERLQTAWGMRQESNLMNLPFLDMRIWPGMKPAERRRWSRARGVTAVHKAGQRQRFKVQTLQYLSKRMPAYAMERAAIEGVHLADFTGAVLPLVPDVTADMLLVAWHLVLDIATLLTKRVPLPEGALSPQKARELAMIVDRASVASAIQEGLNIDASTADRIVSFLTFQFQVGGKKKAGGNKGLWAAPLIEIPASNDLGLPLAVLETSNIVRRVETWLEKGGLNDQRVTNWPATTARHIKSVPPTTESRGDRYETITRSRICDAVSRNSLFTTARCAADEIKKLATFPEQIDLVVSFGDLCLVGEVKFFLMPADPHERVRYHDKLRDAAKQATNKVSALEARPDVLAHALGIDLEVARQLRLLPVIVTAQGYAFSTRVDGVLVVDASFLKLYLATGEVQNGMALEPSTGRSMPQFLTHYTTERAAARNFEHSMEAPYPLVRFIGQVQMGETTLPTLAHRHAVMEMPVVESNSGSIEGVLAQAVVDALRRS